MNDPKQVKKFLMLERKVDRAYDIIERNAVFIEGYLDMEQYDDAYQQVLEMKRAITTIRKTRVTLDAMDVDVSEMPVA